MIRSPGQSICHHVVLSLLVLDDEVELLQVFLPPSLTRREVRLRLEVMQRLMVRPHANSEADTGQVVTPLLQCNTMANNSCSCTG